MTKHKRDDWMTGWPGWPFPLQEGQVECRTCHHSRLPVETLPRICPICGERILAQAEAVAKGV